MPVTTSIDVGTSIIPVPLKDAAIAYSVRYTPDRKKAMIDICQYCQDDVNEGRTPAEAFADLVRSMPGVWNSTYSSLESLLDLEAVESSKRYYGFALIYDEAKFSWTVEKDDVLDFLMNMHNGRDPVMPAAMFDEAFRPKKSGTKNP